MNADRQYDGNLQMFVEGPREPDFVRLSFLRWLGERGLLEHDIAGPSSGPFMEQYAALQVAALPLAS